MLDEVSGQYLHERAHAQEVKFVANEAGLNRHLESLTFGQEFPDHQEVHSFQ